MDLSTYLHEMTDRHQGILSTEEQHILSEAIICGAGAGGVGGWTYLALARLGCSQFRIADPGTFDASNANRQAGCMVDTVGENKAEIVAREIQMINPSSKIVTYPDGLTEKNIPSFLDGGSIVVDGLDLYELEIKQYLYDLAREYQLPVVSCPVLGFGAALALFHPTRSPSFKEYFGPIPKKSDEQEYNRYIRMFATGIFGFKPKLDWSLFTDRVEQGKVPTVGTSCMLSGAMTAIAILDCLLKRNNFPVVPKTVHIDLMQQKVAKTGAFKRWVLKLYINIYFRFLGRK